MRLAEAFVAEPRIGHRGMIFAADAAHEPGDEPAFHQVVDHREFLGDDQRVIDDRQRPADHADGGLFQAPRQRAGQHVGRRHHAVGGLVMFVDADPVEAELVGEFQFVQIAVVKLRALFRIVIGVGQGDPGRLVMLQKIGVDILVRHQVKEMEFHQAAPFWAAVFAAVLWAVNAVTAAIKSSSFSCCGRCPQSGTMVSVDPGISFCIASP